MASYSSINADIITYYKLYEDALDLHDAAQEIYDHISCLPLKDLLKETIPSSISYALRRRPVQKSKANARLSIRLSTAERDKFLKHCQSTGLSQRNAFVALMSQGKKTAPTTKRIAELSQTIDRQKEYIQELSKVIQRGPRGANADKKLIDAFDYAKQGYRAYLSCLFGEETPTGPAHCLTWSKFRELCPERGDYVYPEGDGFIVFELDYLCYGKGTNPAIFLFGRDCQTNQKLRIRYYQRREYIGPIPNRSIYFSDGACLLIGCKHLTEETVADLYFALPLPNDERPTDGENKAATAAPYLDQVLHNATIRSKQSDV